MPTANIGQFNDALQSDVFYCRDVLGINHAILGIVDQSTLLHQAARLPDLSSETTLKLFRDLWFKPYGFPQTIRVDPGGNFALNFRNYVERHGGLAWSKEGIVSSAASWSASLTRNPSWTSTTLIKHWMAQFTPSTP